MGINVSSPQTYQDSLRKLFPRGLYWDKQFADPDSDCSLICKAKADHLVNIRKRMSDLQKESIVFTATETLDSWERVLTGSITFGLDADDRRALLTAQIAGRITLEVLRSIASLYGWTISKIEIPFRSAFFGFSYFGQDRITSPASFSVVYVYANIGNKTAFTLFSECFRRACFGFSRIGHDRIVSPRAASSVNHYIKLSDRDIWEPFEIKLKKSLLANQITFFIYGGGD